VDGPEKDGKTQLEKSQQALGGGEVGGDGEKDKENMTLV
jgi:hypothetical protein